MSAFNEERVPSVHHWTDKLFTFTTTRLQHIRVGDTLIVGSKPTGTLVVDYLLPGKRLYLFATGTGLAPFMSIVRNPETCEQFEQVILVHGVRLVDELACHDLLVEHLPRHAARPEAPARKARLQGRQHLDARRLRNRTGLCRAMSRPHRAPASHPMASVH